MKTNILWKNWEVIGTISGYSPSLEMLPHRLLEKYKENLSLQSPAQQSQSEFTDTDGGVYGVRYFNFAPSMTGGFLVSPTSKFVWESAFATALNFKNAGAVRGHIGFHAGWPCSLMDWPSTVVDHHCTEVKALVKGYGDLVLGTMGWRSEKLQIIKCICNVEKWAQLIASKYGIETVYCQIEQLVDEANKVEWTPKFEAWMQVAFPPPKPKREKIRNEYT